MPFDGISSIKTDQLAKLEAVERLLATEEQWCKGALRGARGRHCLAGAILDAGGWETLAPAVQRAIGEVNRKHYSGIPCFNDDPRTTHADVLEVLRRAREEIIDPIGGVASCCNAAGGESARAGAGLRWLS